MIVQPLYRPRPPSSSRHPWRPLAVIPHLSRFTPSTSALSAMLLSSSLLIACDDADTDGEQVQTALPQNTSPSSSITEAAQESGLTALQICDMLVTNLTSFFLTERGIDAVCNLSAFSGSFSVPNSAGICDSINSGCRSNYSAQGSCTADAVSQISACAIPIGLWRDCIDEQIAFFSAVSEINLNCMDQSSYAKAFESLVVQYTLSSCEQIKGQCPGFASSVGSSDNI
jgi:hypothetical protein